MSQPSNVSYTQAPMCIARMPSYTPSNVQGVIGCMNYTIPSSLVPPSIQYMPQGVSNV